MKVDINDPKCWECGKSLLIHYHSHRDRESDRTRFRGNLCFVCQAVFCSACNHDDDFTCPRCQKSTFPVYRKDLRKLSSLKVSKERQVRDITHTNIERMPGRHHKSVTDAARVMTEDPDADNRFRAANALEQIAPIEALGAFIKGLDDEYNLTRRACVNALVRINTKEAREALKKVLKDEDTDVRESAKRHLDAAPDERLNASLFQAVKEKDKESISQLLQDGADINAKDEDDNSILLHPTQYYDAEMIIFLLSLGANPHASSEGRMSPFLLACSYGEDLEFIAEAFLTAGTDVSVQVEGKSIIKHMRSSDRYSDRVVDSVEKLFRRHCS